MSRKLFAFLLAELTMLRFICKKCGVVCEVPLDHVAHMFSTPSCKNCGARFSPAQMNRSNALVDLAEAIKLVQNEVVSKNLDIELVVPDVTPNV